MLFRGDNPFHNLSSTSETSGFSDDSLNLSQKHAREWLLSLMHMTQKFLDFVHYRPSVIKQDPIPDTGTLPVAWCLITAQQHQSQGKGMCEALALQGNPMRAPLTSPWSHKVPRT